jgi:CubicO group peptidase (beta-lactamase class C family)
VLPLHEPAVQPLLTESELSLSNELQEALSAFAEELDVPGATAGVLLDGVEHRAFHGVTSVENPLPVDEATLFQFGSTGKTLTATAMLRLVEQGLVDLDAPVRTYVPELKLKDEDVAATVTVLQLFNHTAGWQGDLHTDTGPGDDALEKYVAGMAEIEQVTPLGATVSYNNASLALAGRVIAKVTEKTYEQAVKELVLEPLGLTNTLWSIHDIIVRRFAVGHTRHEDGRITIAKPFALPRGLVPAGGWSANLGDQLAWARFHLGDGTTPDGTRLLSKELLDRMKQPTADMPGSALGDHVGISWLLRDIDGVRTVGHGGTVIGQYSDFMMVPERNFAVTSLSNCGPNGSQLNHRLVKWALEHYLGVVDVDAEPLLLGDDALQQYLGRYETIAAYVDVTADAGRLLAKVTPKRELREGENPDEQPPIPIAFLAGDGDRYVIPDGAAKGMKGYFQRNAAGDVDGLHFGGRLATRTGALVPA